MPYPEQQMTDSVPSSGIQMKASAPFFSPRSAGVVEMEQKEKQNSFLTGDDGLVNEDTNLYITAENRLLAATSFEQMGLNPRFTEALYKVMKFNRPSLIQAQAIPYIFAQPRRHLIVQAQNGSGKTICFLLGSLSYIDEAVPAPQVLIVVHTRELALQIADVCSKLCSFTNIKCTCALKGIPFNPAAQVIIGSTDAIKRAIMSKQYVWDYVVSLVIDEADHILDDRHFAADIKSMADLIKTRRLPCQILLFSATFNDRVIQFARRLVPGAIEIRKATTDLCLQTVHMYSIFASGFEAKCTALDKIYKLMDIGQTCIFVNQRETADRLGQWMKEKGHAVHVLRGGDMDLQVRANVLKEFREGKTKVLISTDVLARGIDVLDVTLVVNFDLPMAGDKFVGFVKRSGL